MTKSEFLRAIITFLKPDTAMDDAEFEEKHKRNHGKFAKMHGDKGESGKKGKPSWNAVSMAPSKPVSAYIKDSGGDVRAGCESFYEQEFLGHCVRARDKAGNRINIRFTEKGKRKMRDIVSANQQMSEVLPMLPDIIKNGECLGYLPYQEGKVSGKHHPNHKGFLYYSKKVQTSDGEKRVIVDVGLASGSVYEEYSFTKKGNPGYEQKKNVLQEKLGIVIEDSGLNLKDASVSNGSTSCIGVTNARPNPAKNGRVSAYDDKDNIPDVYEIVNIRIVEAA